MDESSVASNPAARGDDDIAPGHQTELEEFRARWRSELRDRHAASATAAVAATAAAASGEPPSEDSVREHKAGSLFQQGVWAEQHGLVYEATYFYRQALKLVPDIEERLENQLQPKKDVGSPELLLTHAATSVREEDIDDDDAAMDLVQHCCRLKECHDRICEPIVPQQVTHISQLPAEVFLQILRWVVSAELDMRSLEQFSQVCTGFYLLARDSEIWKSACCKVWGKHCRLAPSYRSWREMFVCEPHLMFNGCYISKMAYTRPGERGLDSFYRPYHLVEYYRYCRFFSDGTVLLYTSADDVASTVTKLRNKLPRLQGLLSGVYRVTSGHLVQCVLKRCKWQENNRYRRRQGNLGAAGQADEEDAFHVDLTIKDKPGKKSGVLHWERYAVVTKRRGAEVSSRFSLNPKDYPPLYFARVKSFTAESNAPLQ